MVVSILTVLLGVFLIVIFVSMAMGKKVRFQMQTKARRLLDSMRKNFIPEYELRVLRPEDLPEEGSKHLEEGGNALQKAGGKFVCDMENVTVSGFVGSRIAIRSYTFPDMGFEAAAYYHPKAGHLIYDLSSDLSDGTHFTTSSAESAGKLNSPPGIESVHLPYDTPAEEVIRTHMERLTAARREDPNLEISVWTTPEEIIAKEQRMARIKYEYRRQNGWMFEEEVERLCPPQEKWTAKHIYAAMQKILKEEASAQGSGLNDGPTTEGGSRIIRHGNRKADYEGAVGSEETVERIGKHIEEYIGPVENVYHEVVSDLVHLDLYHVSPSDDRPFHTFVTCGMSDRPMSPPAGVSDRRYAELTLLLPPDWPVSQEAFQDESWYWPLRLLKMLARFPHEYQTWLWMDHTIPNGDPPEPFDPSTELCCALLSAPSSLPKEFSTLRIDARRQVAFLSLLPLYKEEMDFKLSKGSDKLLRRLSDAGVTDVLDARRENVCRRG